MLPIGTILCPTDFSKEAAAAFDVACALARDSRARLIVLHVERPPLTTLGGQTFVPPLPSEYDRERLREKLLEIRPPETNIAVEHRLEFGEPETVILDVAAEVRAGLIVMGIHGHSGLRRLLMGSVAEHVVRKASCPVLTVRAPLATELARPTAAEESTTV
jgi:nucleotide-binding universal stress UspA family protein